MTFMQAVTALCGMTDALMPVDEKPYMTAVNERIVVESAQLYSVRIIELDGNRRNVFAEPYAPYTVDLFRTDWEVVKP